MSAPFTIRTQAELFSACERAYAVLGAHEWPGRNTPAGQALLCDLRDAICKVTGRNAPEPLKTSRQGATMTAARKGRAPSVPPVERYYVTLDAATVERAKLLGAGNLSGGLREAVKRVRLPFEAEPGI